MPATPAPASATAKRAAPRTDAGAGAGGVKAILMRRYAGVPGGVWFGAGVLALAAFIYWRRKKAAVAKTPATDAQTGGLPLTQNANGMYVPTDMSLSGLSGSPAPDNSAASTAPPAAPVAAPAPPNAAPVPTDPQGEFIDGLYKAYLHRAPNPEEMGLWRAAWNARGPSDVWHGVAYSPPALAARNNAPLTWGSNPPHVITGV